MTSSIVTPAFVTGVKGAEERRTVAREGILANFRFFKDISEEVWEGITTNISSSGFRFLTRASIREGQTLTITEHMIPDFRGRKAFVTWVKREPLYFEAGAKIR